MVGAIMYGHEEIKKICAFIEEKIVPAVGKPKLEMELYHVPEELDKTVREYASKKIDWAIAIAGEVILMHISFSSFFV